MRAQSVLPQLLLLLLVLAPLPVRAEGTWWDGFLPPPLGQGVDAQVLALGSYGQQLVAGGDLTDAGGVPVAHIARWNGTAWSPLGLGTDSAVSALTVFNGDLIAGGWFLQAGGESASYVARWDGTAWHALGAGTNNAVRALCVYQGDLIAGGVFTQAGGQPAAYIARWNGSSWAAMGTLSGRVETLAVYHGRLYAAGMFDYADGVLVHHVASWDGAGWQGVQGGLQGLSTRVRALQAHGGRLFAAGLFSDAGGVVVSNIASWDGVSWAALADGLSDEVRALSVYGPDLVASGYFLTAGGSPASRIARWDGLAWHSLGAGLGDVAWALYPMDGSLYVGGLFTAAGGLPSSHIACWTDPATWGHEHHVSQTGDGSYTTIQAAVDAAAADEGDDLLVAPGSYPENIAVLDKNLRLRSEAGAASTSVLSFAWRISDPYGYPPVPSGGLLDGFTVSDSSSAASSDPFDLTGCRLLAPLEISITPDLGEDMHLLSNDFSGPLTVCTGISMGSGVVEVADCVFHSGCRVFASNLRIDACTFDHCDVTAHAEADFCEIRGSDFTGGGIDVNSDGHVYISGNGMVGAATAIQVEWCSAGGYVMGNTISECGTGIFYGLGSELDIIDNWISECGTGIRGWAVACRGNTVSDCQVGMTFMIGDGVIERNTVFACKGPGIHVEVELDLALGRNNVVGNHQGIVIDGPDQSQTIACNNSWGNASGNWVGVPDPTGLDGNISADPLFCDAAAGDLTLHADSPCAPEQQPACGLIGALPVRCEGSEVAQGPLLSDSFTLGPVFPNPCGRSTWIQYGIPRGAGEERVVLDVYDPSGRRVTRLVQAPRPPGSYTAIWNSCGEEGRGVASGVYFLRLAWPAGERTVRVLVLR